MAQTHIERITAALTADSAADDSSLSDAVSKKFKSTNIGTAPFHVQHLLVYLRELEEHVSTESDEDGLLMRAFIATYNLIQIGLAEHLNIKSGAHICILRGWQVHDVDMKGSSAQALDDTKPEGCIMN